MLWKTYRFFALLALATGTLFVLGFTYLECRKDFRALPEAQIHAETLEKLLDRYGDDALDEPDSDESVPIEQTGAYAIARRDIVMSHWAGQFIWPLAYGGIVFGIGYWLLMAIPKQIRRKILQRQIA